MSLSDRIVQCRTEKGLSQNQLARLMDVSRQAVSKWENGLSVPDAAKIIRLSEILDISWEYLATGRTNVASPGSATDQINAEPNIEYIERVVVKRVIRKQYLRNPVEYALVCLVGIAIGIVLGLLL